MSLWYTLFHASVESGFSRLPRTQVSVEEARDYSAVAMLLLERGGGVWFGGNGVRKGWGYARQCQQTGSLLRKCCRMSAHKGTCHTDVCLYSCLVPGAERVGNATAMYSVLIPQAELAPACSMANLARVSESGYHTC